MSIQEMMNRRQLLRKIVACTVLPGIAIASGQAVAGQVEEPLTNSMATALASAVDGTTGVPRIEYKDAFVQLDYFHWLGSMSGRLKSRIPNEQIRIEFLETVWYESHRAGLETALVMGLIQTESAFRQYAISVAGAIGYMQVMPFWTRLIGDGDLSKLFHTQTNLRYGCVILRHYIDMEKGNLFMALGRYNGSRGQSKYPDTVFRFRENWLHETAPILAASTRSI